MGLQEMLNESPTKISTPKITQKYEHNKISPECRKFLSKFKSESTRVNLQPWTLQSRFSLRQPEPKWLPRLALNRGGCRDEITLREVRLNLNNEVTLKALPGSARRSYIKQLTLMFCELKEGLEADVLTATKNEYRGECSRYFWPIMHH